MKVIIDTDFGIDDALSVLFLTASTEAQILAITLVAGSCHMDIVSQNVETITKLIRNQRIPVYLASSFNMEGRFMEGNEYFVPIPPEKIVYANQWETVRRDMSSVQALLHYTQLYPGEIHGIFIGPLTNLALAFLIDNEFPSRFASIYIAGSDRSEKTIKNVSKYAEFNAWCDPMAYVILKECISKIKVPIKIVDLTICVQNPLPFSLEERVKEYNNMLAKINKYLNLFDLFLDRNNIHTINIYHDYGLILPDICAAVGLIYPKVFKTEKVSIKKVEISGKRRGHIEYEEDPKGNLLLVYGIDTELISKIIIATIFRWDILQSHFLDDFVDQYL